MEKLQMQKPAPPFTSMAVVDGMLKQISLRDYRGRYLVLFFYPLDFSFVCPSELLAFANRSEDFKKANTAVVACSTDSEYAHLAWVYHPTTKSGLGDMHIPLLSDKSLAISRAYGVLCEETGVPFRSLFIIDRQGTLRRKTISDYQVEKSVDDILRLVQSLQIADNYGEVCTAGIQK